MNKLRTLLTVIALASLSFVSQAQTNTGKVIGNIMDGTHGLEAATVSLLNPKDSVVNKLTLTDKAGNFSFEKLEPGQYLVGVSAVGFLNSFSGLFEINKENSSIVLKTIVLRKNGNELKGVTVVARKPLIEQKIDRTIINVEAAVSNVGATALEVLEKSPGITVDKDGNISLKGKQGVQVFIDGKPSYLNGADLVNLLKNMNANQLDQIEIMTNPPAKYDAAGNSGIINIKTKKNKQKGFNGSITAGYSQGSYWRTNESLNLNYRNGKFNAFMNYSYNKNNQFQELDIHRTFLDGTGKDIRALFDQKAFMPNSNDYHNLKLGLDYYLSPKTTIGFVTTGFLNPEHFRNYNTSYLQDGNNKLDSIVYSTSDMKDTWKNGSVNLNFRHQYDSTGRELSADIDFSKYGSHNIQNFANNNYMPDWTLKDRTFLYSETPVDINIYSAKMDYTHPFKNGLKFETGWKSSYVNTDNAANYFNIINGIQEVDYSKPNRFQYKENINAGYVNFNKQIKKFGIQIGLRVENTHYTGKQMQNDSSFNHTYTNLFPTAFFTFNANQNNQFGLSLGRRIDRPDYQDLNPFLFFLDIYTYQAGNPFLQPQYTNNIEFSHTFKGFLTTTLNYSHTKNMFSETFEQNPDTSRPDKGFATIVRQGNIGQRDNVGLSISAQVKFTKWWSANLYGNYNYNHFQGLLYGDPIDVKASNVLFNVNNQFTIGKGWSAELSGFYRTKGIEGQVAINGLGQATAGVSKQVMKGKGSIRLNVRDLFYTNKVTGSIDFQKTQATFHNIRDSRVASLSFTYRFGKPLKGPQGGKRDGGATDEQSRVKVGGNN